MLPQVRPAWQGPWYWCWYKAQAYIQNQHCPGPGFEEKTQKVNLNVTINPIICWHKEKTFLSNIVLNFLFKFLIHLTPNSLFKWTKQLNFPSTVFVWPMFACGNTKNQCELYEAFFGKRTAKVVIFWRKKSI